MGSCGSRATNKNEAGKRHQIFDPVANTVQAGNNMIIIDILNSKGGRITKEYTLLNPPIGKGATSEVRKAIHRKSGQMRAVKIIPFNPMQKEIQQKIQLEVEMLQLLDHPNILKIQESYLDDRFFYIVTELCSGGELFQRIEQTKKFSEIETAKIMKQLLRAVFYLHQLGVVHRDIRPENILFESERDDAQIRLVDFGSAKFYDSVTKLSNPVGQPFYMAPEMYGGKKYDEKCDVWACGVIMYILLCGYPPFLGKNDQAIKKKVLSGIYQFEGEDWISISNDAKEMIKKMLQLDVIRRYSAQEALSDCWLNNLSKQIDVEDNQLRRVFQNMITYKTPVKLQEVTLSMIVFFLASKEEKQELMQIFQSLDLNNDGRLSVEELKNGMQRIMTYEEADQHSQRIIQLVDKKGHGSLDYSTFLVISIDRQNLLTKNRMETAFKMIDRNGSGGIAVDELKETFKCNKDYDEVWKQIISEVDRNQDGQISLTEFKEMLLRLTK